MIFIMLAFLLRVSLSSFVVAFGQKHFDFLRVVAWGYGPGSKAYLLTSKSFQEYETSQIDPRRLDSMLAQLYKHLLGRPGLRLFHGGRWLRHNSRKCLCCLEETLAPMICHDDSTSCLSSHYIALN